MDKALKKTPLHPAHLQLGAKMVPFAGYEMPVQYESVLKETQAVRKAGGLFDVSHMGQVRVKGAGALDAVNAMVTNNLLKLKDGQAQYNMLCNDQGGVIDDLVVYRLSSEEIYICINASNRDNDVPWMQEHLPASLAFTDESDDTALIAVQGPKAESLIEALGGDVTDLKYYWAKTGTIAGAPCLISRTGYTGEDGFELYVPAEHALNLWNALMEQGTPEGVCPIGLGARDTLRLEMGYPLHGQELSPSITPLQAGLGWVVKLDKETDFPGKTPLVEEKAAGPHKKLVALVVSDRRIPRTGYTIHNAGGEPVGQITSGTQSPHLGSPIALGFVRSDAASDEEFHIAVREEKIAARRTRLPFVTANTKRTK